MMETIHGGIAAEVMEGILRACNLPRRIRGLRGDRFKRRLRALIAAHLESITSLNGDARELADKVLEVYPTLERQANSLSFVRRAFNEVEGSAPYSAGVKIRAERAVEEALENAYRIMLNIVERLIADIIEPH